MEVTATMKVHIKFYMILLMMQQLQSQLPPPLLIDLNGDGIEIITIQNGVYFDHENDGFAESSSWVEKIMAL